MLACRLRPWLLLPVILSCQETDSTDGAFTTGSQRTWLVSAADPTSECADVLTTRVCWGTPARSEPGCDTRACVVERTLPDVPSSSGWRCTGTGPDRICRPRTAWASLFVSSGDRFVQAHPRLPSDGQWDCADTAGVTVCMGGAEPAGVAPSAPVPGYRCGRRPGKDHQQRVCVDLSPDVPDPNLKWDCRFVSEGLLRRECRPSPDAHQLGDPCSSSKPCVDGARCLAGRCIPPKPEPNCAFDKDCKNGVCRFGTCRARSR